MIFVTEPCWQEMQGNILLAEQNGDGRYTEVYCTNIRINAARSIVAPGVDVFSVTINNQQMHESTTRLDCHVTSDYLILSLWYIFSNLHLRNLNSSNKHTGESSGQIDTQPLNK